MFSSFYSADSPVYYYQPQIWSSECLPSYYAHYHQYEDEYQSAFSEMKSGTTWAERGPDGKTYFIRKKSKLPSARELITEALHPRRIRSLPFSKIFRKDFHIFPAPEPPYTMFPYPFNPAPRQENTNTSQNYQGTTLRSEPQRYQFPHPNMYPIPPQISQFPPQTMAYGPTNHRQQLPPEARLISPPRFPTPDDLKYKCNVCGKFRSPRYHYKHPIPPGELPAKTTCRRCREEATDSEDEHSSESLGPRRSVRRRPLSKSRSRAPIHIVTEPKIRERRARSLSRIEILPRGRSRSLVRQSRRHDSYSRSSSRETHRVRLAIEDRPRRRSPSVEIVRRYIEERPRRRTSFEEEVVYIDDNRRYRSSSTYYEPYHPSDEEYDYPGRLHVTSRAPTPIPRIIRRQYSDPYIRAPATIERREYLDGPNSVIEERSVVQPSRSVSRASSRNIRIVSEPQYRPQIRREFSQSEEEYQAKQAPRRQYRHEEDWYANRGRPRRRSRHERSRSRLGGVDRKADYEHSPGPLWVQRAPSPSSATGSSSLGYIEPRPHHEEVEVTRTMQHDAVDRGGRPATVNRRRRSRSRSVIESIDAQEASTLLKPGDHVTVVERREAPARDYDWYDKSGMKIRVREI